MMKRVLIATDGSMNAEKAVAMGADLAAKFDAEVVLLHVLLRDHLSDAMRHLAESEYHAADKPFADAIGQIPNARFPLVHLLPKDAASPADALRAAADQVLHRAETIAREHGATKIKTMTEDGRPAARISQVAEETGADLIVTGARGLSNLTAMVLGSVSQRLASTAPVSCLTVH